MPGHEKCRRFKSRDNSYVEKEQAKALPTRRRRRDWSSIDNEATEEPPKERLRPRTRSNERKPKERGRPRTTAPPAPLATPVGNPVVLTFDFTALKGLSQEPPSDDDTLAINPASIYRWFVNN
jgi:hypothetical protein